MPTIIEQLMKTNGDMGDILSNPCPADCLETNPIIDGKQLIERAFEKVKYFDEVHEITITFKDKHLKNTNVLVLYTNVIDYIKKYIKRKQVVSDNEGNVIAAVDPPKNYHILGVPEFSQSGRFHIHCMIWINGYQYHITELKRLLYNRYGRCTGKKIFNKNNFKNYILKDIEKQDGCLVPFYLEKEEGAGQKIMKKI